MARPSATTLLTSTIDDIEYEVLAADTYYYIIYREEPITLRTTYWSSKGRLVKYNKTGYTSLASTQRLVDTLNNRYNCQDFSYTKIGK
jgi:hypothetical protein